MDGKKIGKNRVSRERTQRTHRNGKKMVGKKMGARGDVGYRDGAPTELFKAEESSSANFANCTNESLNRRKRRGTRRRGEAIGKGVQARREGPFRHEPSNEHAAPTELGEGPRDVGSYRHGAPTELLKSVHGGRANILLK